jgi:GNAT superfamily N-acetyltransferase
MKIRRIEDNDLEKLLPLYMHLHEADVKVSEEKLRGVWRTILLNRDLFIYLVAEENENIVATCNISLIPNLTRGGSSIALIENVVTHQDYRRRGIGKAIIMEAINIAKENKCYKVMLMTNALRKEAHAFYKKIGFSSTDKVGFVMKLNY